MLSCSLLVYEDAYHEKKQISKNRAEPRLASRERIGKKDEIRVATRRILAKWSLLRRWSQKEENLPKNFSQTMRRKEKEVRTQETKERRESTRQPCEVHQFQKKQI